MLTMDVQHAVSLLSARPAHHSAVQVPLLRLLMDPPLAEPRYRWIEPRGEDQSIGMTLSSLLTIHSHP